MTEPDTARNTGTPRWVKILLVVSLALNFIFIGLSAGLILRNTGNRSAVARDGALLLARAMPPKDRRDMQREFRQRRGEILSQFPDRLEQRDRIIAILVQTPFDPDALQNLLAQQRQRGLRIATAGHETVVAQLSEMSEQERAAIARNLRNIRGRKGE